MSAPSIAARPQAASTGWVARAARSLPFWLPLLIGGGALLATSFAAPARTAAGVYFLVVLIPGLQLLAWTFFGPRPAAAIGVATALLTLWQVSVPPRPTPVEPARWQWDVAFTAPGQQLRATLRPPQPSRAAALLAGGGQATLFICRSRGSLEDLDLLFDGRPMDPAGAKGTDSCWSRLALPPGALPAPPAGVEVVIRPRGGQLPPETSRAVLVGGYTRPRSDGGQSGGGAFFDGTRWREDDLSPSAADAQQGRYFVEVRVTDAAGRVREVWF